MSSTLRDLVRRFQGSGRLDAIVLRPDRLKDAVSVQEGAVRLASASGSASVSGRVGPDGTVGLNVSNGTASGAISGRLQSQSGGGTWKVSSLCSGRWTARRQTTRTAQAD